MPMAEDAPPSFPEDSEGALPPGYDGHAPLTAATSFRPLVERVFTLETSKKHAWATLKVNSRGGKSTSVPSFVQGDIITGTVELSLEKTEHIQAVSIEVRGESLTVGQEPVPFITQRTTLWSTSMGDPGTDNSGSGSPKLKGDYVWPFSISLPDTVTMSTVEKGATSEYPLPPSYSERASPSYLDYKLVATFHRRMLRVDDVLSTSFAYLPRSRPPAPSALREVAYRQDTAPPGPKADPEGWEDLGTKSVTGTVFDSRTVEVACTFFLAKPLCYARGTIIPFAFNLSCSDRQALDLFAGRGTLAIYLVRALRMGADTTNQSKAARSDNIFFSNVGRGIYWPSEDDNVGSETRRLEGEIPVSGVLKPSFLFPRMAIKYHVSFSLTASGFTVTSGDGGTEPTFSREVEIATIHAPGPVPRSRVPTSSNEGQSGNYDVSIGMLTAANQRFIHHHVLG